MQLVLKNWQEDIPEQRANNNWATLNISKCEIIHNEKRRTQDGKKRLYDIPFVQKVQICNRIMEQLLTFRTFVNLMKRNSKTSLIMFRIHCCYKNFSLNTSSSKLQCSCFHLSSNEQALPQIKTTALVLN